MISFTSDYVEGAHPLILKKLIETNMEQLPGYGNDCYTISAQEKIRSACGCPDAEVFLLEGGTQTNSVVIGTMLRPYEGVVAARTGHIALHEAGAIEHLGHKVLTLPEHNGKIEPNELLAMMKDFYADCSHDHMVFPGMVYLSYPTEYGTLYSRKELEAIATVCHEYNLPLYLDGARLAYGLMSPSADLTLKDIARICDVFYIGGTKVGALCGEAVVFTRRNAPKQFITMVKQNGAMMAKGRVLGIQFDVLFTDNLYLELGKHAIDMSQQVKEAFRSKGYSFLLDSPTNQQFVILDNEKKRKFGEKVLFEEWEKVDDVHTAVRFATSWATLQENIDELKKII